MVAQRGRLRAAHVPEPAEIGVGDFTERHAARPAFVLDTVAVGRFGHVFARDPGGGHDRRPLAVGAIWHAAAARTPAAVVGIALKPRRADAALDLAPVVAELRLVERLPALLADDDVGARWRRHANIVQGRGYHLGTRFYDDGVWVPLWVPNRLNLMCQS